MAFESDELNKRRALRQQRAQQRVQQKKKTRRKLLIAAAVLVVCGILIFAVSRNSAQPPAAPAVSGSQATTAPVTETTEPVATTQPPTTVVHLAAAGDLNITDALVDAGGVGRDYTSVFMDVLPLLSDADITVLNFEGNAVGQPYGAENCSAPPELLDTLVRSGVDMVQVANSRTITNGMIGLSSTLQAVRLAGLEPLGAYASVDEAKDAGGYVIREVNGVSIAFIAFTKGMDSMSLPTGSERCINLLYTDYATTYQDVNTEGIEDVIRAAKQERPDIIVALLHWGSEYNDNISDTQQEIIDLMYEEGVDAIIGTHPHYVQKMEFDQEEGTFLCYSLGDLVGDTTRAGTEYSVILDLEITKDNDTGKTAITGYSYTPIFTVVEDGSLKVVRLGDAVTAYNENNIQAVSEDTYDSLIYAQGRIEERVNPTEPTEE